MLRTGLAILVAVGLLPQASPQQPQVKVNVLNVCSPSAEDQQQIASALERIPLKTSFTQDFEVDRGRSLLDQAPDFLRMGQAAQMSASEGTSDWVRIRREFPASTPFTTAQYSFSRDTKNMIETLVFRMRDPKDVLLVSIEAGASAVTTPAAMLTTDTPASRIKLERFGKSSIVLARCSATEGGPAPDQSAYEPLFQKASGITRRYRELLNVRHTVPDELGRVGTAGRQGRQVSKEKTPAAKSK